jgi:thymidylate synthase (FAD)
MKIAPISVEYVNHMGDDLAVVNAARVSFDKESNWELVDAPQYGCDPNELYTQHVLSEQDKKLINYLAKNNHWSPFAHNSITLRIKAPIFVARQLVKHQVGGVWNEVSRRYVDSEPEFYFPDVWRKAAKNVKQGSSDEKLEMLYPEMDLDMYIESVLAETLSLYQTCLSKGMCPEQARMILPQNTMTEWWWTGSLMFFARVCKLRLDPHSQKETQEVAQLIAEQCEKLFPYSWEALFETT